MGALQTYIRSGGCLVVAAGLTSLSFTPLTILCTSQISKLTVDRRAPSNPVVESPPEPAAIFQGGSEPARTRSLRQVLNCNKTPQS